MSLDRQDSERDRVVAAFAKSVAALDALQKAVGRVPEHLLNKNSARNGTEFDPNGYFTVLTHLSMEEGYVLDYVYYYGRSSGHPVLFTRTVGGSCAIPTAEQLCQAENYGESHLDHVRCDGTPEGYFELALFASQASRFYFYDHALYGKRAVIPEKSAITHDLVRKEEADLLARMQDAFIPPDITIVDDKGRVTVSFCTFSYWIGLIREEYKMCAAFPHLISNTASTTLCPYHCGLMF